MFKFKIDFTADSKKFIDKMPTLLDKGIRKGVQKAILIAERGAKRRSPVLTGHLRRSIRSGTKFSIRKSVGWIGSDVIYARIQEEGGIIKPKRGKYLKFKIRGQWKSVKSVKIKGKKYLEHGITESMSKIKDVIRQAIIDSYNRER